ncbi:MAG: MFS transporter [Bdellovibrionota bacterium]
MKSSENLLPGVPRLAGREWLVLLAGWLGWGFAVYDALLFNYISALCVPDLLGLSPGDPGAKGKITFWTGALTALLLVGWALGGILFGRVTDRLGRTKTLALTMLTFSVFTAACGLAPDLWTLSIFRFIASLGVGGEWAAGAALVAEVMPARARVWAGAVLYTASPAGLFLATFANQLLTQQIPALAADPSLAWRVVFLSGLLPVIPAAFIAAKIKEPERWAAAAQDGHGSLSALFAPKLRRKTLGGLAMAMTALVTWWSCNAFIPTIARFLADEVVPLPPPNELPALRTLFVTRATATFNLCGLIGTMLTVPLATRFGRRPMFLVYFLAASILIALAFGAPLDPHARLYCMGLVGLPVFGVFGSFTYYLPELFPTRLRGTGSGFCYNTGRIVTAAFALLIGFLGQFSTSPLHLIRWVALAPLGGIAILLLGLVEETKGKDLE